MKGVNVLIKPASSACTMACGYCFYRDVGEHRGEAYRGMLSLEKLEEVIANALGCAEEYCAFGYQGGEPTLAGLDFFRNAVELQRRCNGKGIAVHNAIQTNGLAIDGEWARFFRDNDFLVGLSVDGSAELHNRFRPDASGKGTFSRVMRTLRLFRETGVRCNILSVVTNASARHVASTYRFLLKNGITHMQFIPCLDSLDGSDEAWLSVEEYGRFLVRIWDLWFADLRAGRYVSIRHIDNWLSILMGQQPEACNMAGRCSAQFVVEGDGGVYPCDFYVLDEWRLGDVGTSLEELASGERAREFVSASFGVPERCRACRWYPLCRNGCRRERTERCSDGLAYTHFCDAFRYFFESRSKEMTVACSLLARARPIE